MGAKHAKWFVRSAKTTGWLRETELVPKTQGLVSAIKQTGFALKLAQEGQGAAAVPAARRGGRRARRARSTTSSRRRGARALPASSRASTRSAASSSRRRRGARERSGDPARRRAAARGGLMQRVAYYTGCLASLSAKELDTSTQALAPKLGLELVELESVTCCGAGDIHEAEPDYYLHLNARILAYAEETGCETLMTICNVCTLNLRQANWQLKNDDALRARVNKNLETVGVPPYCGDGRGQAPALADRRRRRLRAAEGRGAQGPEGPEDRAVLRLPDPAAVEDPRLRGPGPAVVARGDHPGLRRRAGRLPGEDQVLRLPDHPGARGDRARRADPADRAGDGGRRRRDGHAVPALPPLARRVAAEARRSRPARTSRCRSCTSRS